MRTAALNALLFCSILLTAAAALAAPRDLLAHGDADDLWTARVSTVTEGASTYEQSELRGRAGFGEKAWRALRRLIVFCYVFPGASALGKLCRAHGAGLR